MNRLERVILAVAIIVIVLGSFSIRVHGEDNNKIHIKKNTVAETEFLQEVKTRLDSMGYENAGISLTKAVNETGGLDYTISIHHRRIDKMDEYQREALSDIIIGDGINAVNCSVSTEFIEYM